VGGMTDEDIRRALRDVKASMAQESARTHARIDALSARVDILALDVAAVRGDVGSLSTAVLGILAEVIERLERIEGLLPP
jgi:hypothetical protein